MTAVLAFTLLLDQAAEAQFANKIHALSIKTHMNE